MNTVQHPTAVSVDPESEHNLYRWQHRLLRFMTGSLIVMAAFFFVATVWLFLDLTERVQYKQTDMIAVMNALPKAEDLSGDRTYREWYVRVILEKSALEQRFALQSMVVQGRLWTRVMGFLTGMILCFSGCVFVLGKLREPPTQAAAEGSGFKASLSTSSPGVFLAFTGAVLIGLTLYVPASVESSDASVYLPRQVEVVDPGPLAPVSRELPTPLAPVSPVTGTVDVSVPPLPESVMQQLQDSKATSRSR